MSEQVQDGAAVLWQRLVTLHETSDDTPLDRAKVAESCLADTECVRRLLRETRNDAIREAVALGYSTPAIMRMTGLSRRQVERVRRTGSTQ